MSESLCLDDVSVAFPGTRGKWSTAVDHVSVEVRAGEKVGLVGESGSGKSITAFAALGLVPAPGKMVSGSVKVDSDHRGQRAIALVFQEATTALNPVFSVGYQLCETLRAHRQLSRTQTRNLALQLIEEVGLGNPDGMLKAYPHQLSGGQVQRVMIAIALASEPLFLIADEPTTALDVLTQAQILRLFRAISENKGIGLLLISHDLEVVADITERVYVMYRGRIVEQGPSGMLFREPIHPYTQLLLSSARAQVATSCAGTIEARVGPSPEHGCPFRARCCRAEATCATEAPALQEIDGCRMVRCPPAWRDKAHS